MRSWFAVGARRRDDARPPDRDGRGNSTAGLRLLDEPRHDRALADYHLLPSARADLLEQLGRFGDDAAEFEAASELTNNVRQKRRLLERAAACRSRT